MIELIPAIDVIDGKCVRLSQGDYDTKKIYNEDPLEVAKQFEDNGIKRLHIVDLDGAKSHHIINHKILNRVSSKTSLIIDFGGGIKSDDDLTIAFENGANMVTIGSIAVTNPELMEKWINLFKSERIILGADAKDEKISINGWKENSDIDLFSFLSDYKDKGISKVLCTDISKDGMLQGPAISLYKSIMKRFPDMHLIASGGVSSVEDIELLNQAGIPAVVFGKAFYEGRITFDKIKRFI